MKKLVVILCMCLCACSSYKNRYLGKYDNVSYNTNEIGYVCVHWYDIKFNETTMQFEVIKEKHWTIDSNNLSFVWEKTKDTHLTNTFYEFRSFYRLVVYDLK